MSGLELALAILSGVAMGIALDRWLLPSVVDAWRVRAMISRPNRRYALPA